MNRSHIAGFAAALAVLALLVFTAWSLFEIYPETKYLPRSREARTNEYLALDRWLGGSGIPFRVERSGDLSMISRAEERQIFIQASLFDWTDEAVEYLARWIDEGGSLFLALETDHYDREPFLLLEEFGIRAETGPGTSGYHYEPAAPSFDDDVSFEVLQDEDALTLKDPTGLARLVEVKRGKGKLIVTGQPFFLRNSNLGDAPNARLAWAVFAADSPPGPWFFIRGSVRARGLLGSLWREGNFVVLLASVLVLLVAGFWAVIPVFGLVRHDDEKAVKPLRERFLAEGRFLKRYGALDFYRAVYVKEIKRRLARREGLTADDEIERRLIDISRVNSRGRPTEERDLLVRALYGEPFKYREFPKMIVIFKTILERI